MNSIKLSLSFLTLSTLSLFIGCGGSNSTSTNPLPATTDDPPELSSASVTNPSPTNSITYHLSYGSITHSYTSYCILENDSDATNCSWTVGILPSTFTVSTVENAKTLTVWIRNKAGMSAPVDTNSVTLDISAPVLDSATVTNSNPSNTAIYNLIYGTITGTYVSYCILENDTALGDCAFISGSVPSTFVVSNVQNSKTLSIWLKDDARNISDRVDTNAVTLSTSFTDVIPFDASTESQYTFDSSKIDFASGVVRLTPANHVDQNNSVTGFGGGVGTGVEWDSTNGFLRASDTGTCDGSFTNCSELEASWTPQFGSLTAYWKLNGVIGNIADAAIIPATVGSDITANNGNGTGMAYAPGKLQEGINFDGQDDHLATTIPMSMFNNSFTWIAWVTSGPNANDSGFISHSVVPATENFICGKVGGSGAIRFATGDFTSNYFLDAPVNVADGFWHQVACIYDRTANKKYIYFDGVQVASVDATNAGSTADFGDLVVGGTDIGIATSYWNGSIDDLAVFSAPLAASEVAQMYDRQKAAHSGSFISRIMNAGSWGTSLATWTDLLWQPTLPFGKNLPDFSVGVQNETSADYPSLVGSTGTIGDDDLMSGISNVWHFNEASGTTFADTASAVSNTGTTSGIVTVGVPGQIGNAVTLADGSIALSSTVSLAGDFTLSGWFKPTNDAAVTDSIFGQADPGNNTNFFSGYYRLFDGSSDIVVSTVFAAAGIWHHYVITRSGTVVNLYVDGLQNATGTLFGAYTFNALGQDSVGLTNGTLDEIAVWNRSLQPSEVQQLYRRGSNNIRFQVKSCALSDCTDASWKGPDGTNQTYFSELNNNTMPLSGLGITKAVGPDMAFSDFISPPANNRYFQYQTFLQSDDLTTSCDYGSGATTCVPEMLSVSILPTHYDATIPTIYNMDGPSFSALSSFSIIPGTKGCADTPKFTLSIDKSSWYYWNGANWVSSNNTYNQANISTAVNSHIAAFSAAVGMGSLYVKTYLSSSGSNPCEIDSISVGGYR